METKNDPVVPAMRAIVSLPDDNSLKQFKFPKRILKLLKANIRGSGDLPLVLLWVDLSDWLCHSSSLRMPRGVQELQALIDESREHHYGPGPIRCSAKGCGCELEVGVIVTARAQALIDRQSTSLN